MRITLFNVRNRSTMKMELDRDEGIRDIADIASEAWGHGDKLVLRDGYSILGADNDLAGVRDGDVIEVLPDPFR